MLPLIHRWFIVSITSGLFGTFLTVCLSLSLFVLFFADRDSLRYSCDREDHNITECDPQLRVFGAPVPDPLFPTFIAIIGLLAVVTLTLMGHLTAFHFYLSKFYFCLSACEISCKCAWVICIAGIFPLLVSSSV